MATSAGFTPAWAARLRARCASFDQSRVLLSRQLPHPPSETLPIRQAAVLIPLCNRHGQPSILFNVRTDRVGTHKGQVSFPGGHLEHNETAAEAALRETYEEMGRDIGDIEIVGLCQTVPAITGTMVTPVIGWVHRDVEDFGHFVLSSDEVAKVFTRSLLELNTEGYGTLEKLSRNGKEIIMPVYGRDAGDERIWGLTAFILDAVLKKVVNPTAVAEGV